MGDIEDTVFLDLDNIVDMISACSKEDIEYVATQLQNILTLIGG